MRPALTREEWARELQRQAKPEFPGDGIRGGAVVETQCGEHAIAAVCLHGQPFGFWPELPKTLRIAAERLRTLTGAPDEWVDLDVAADRIEALLPPED